MNPSTLRFRCASRRRECISALVGTSFRATVCFGVSSRRYQRIQLELQFRVFVVRFGGARPSVFPGDLLRLLFFSRCERPPRRSCFPPWTTTKKKKKTEDFFTICSFGFIVVCFCGSVFLRATAPLVSDTLYVSVNCLTALLLVSVFSRMLFSTRPLVCDLVCIFSIRAFVFGTSIWNAR